MPAPIRPNTAAAVEAARRVARQRRLQALDDELTSEGYTVFPPPPAGQERPVDIGPIFDRITAAIASPNAVVGRRLGPSWGPGQPGYAEEQESQSQWAARAVAALLTQPGSCGCPGGYDFTPPPTRYVINHTDQCDRKDQDA